MDEQANLSQARRHMRVVIIASPLTLEAGVANFWRDLIPRIEPLVGSVRLLTGHKSLDFADMPRLGLDVRSAVWVWSDLPRILRGARTTHVVTSISQSDILFGLFCAWRLKLPWTIFIHGQPYPVRGQSGFAKRLLWTTLWTSAAQQCSAFMAVSVASGHRYRSSVRKPLSIVYPAVMPLVSNCEIPEIRQSGAMRIGFIGRLSPEKDPALFGKIAHTNPHHSFEASGSGQLEASLRAEYPGVVWRGHIGTREAFRGLDIMLMTSVSEGLPLVVLEAAQYGVVPLCADVGGVSEAIHPDLHHILLVPEEERGDLKIWAERIDELTRGDIRMKIVELQRKWLIRFSGESSAEEFVHGLEGGVR